MVIPGTNRFAPKLQAMVILQLCSGLGPMAAIGALLLAVMRPTEVTLKSCNGRARMDVPGLKRVVIKLHKRKITKRQQLGSRRSWNRFRRQHFFVRTSRRAPSGNQEALGQLVEGLAAAPAAPRVVFVASHLEALKARAKY